MKLMHTLRIALIVLTTVTIWGGQGTAWAFYTDFEGYAIGTPAESISLPGADLASGAAPNSWIVQMNTGDYVLLSGKILQSTVCDAALIMHFDSLQSDLDFLFGTTASTDIVKVDGWVGIPGPGTLVFSHSYNGTFLGSPAGMLEGQVSLSGTEFNYIVLYAPGGCLAIDDFSAPGLGGPGPDMVTLPETAAVGTFVASTPAYWAPDPDASTGVMFEAGKTIWVLGVDESGDYYKVVLSGIYLWVPVESLGPNYDEVWNGAPLPAEIMQ